MNLQVRLFNYSMEVVRVTPLRRTLLPDLNVVVVVSKGMKAVKLCSHKIL